MKEDEQEGEANFQKKFLWVRRAPITVIGVLMIGIVGSTLYDLLVKPGLTSIGRLILDVITLGSTTVRDSAYSSAALDPTPLSALFLLLGAFALASFPAIDIFVRTRQRKEISSIRNKLKEAEEEAAREIMDSALERVNRRLRLSVLFFWILFIPGWVGSFVGFSVHNQSIVIWRAFNANVTILAPQITTTEKAQLTAQFASMNSAGDYRKIEERMDELAKKHNVKLRTINTW